MSRAKVPVPRATSSASAKTSGTMKSGRVKEIWAGKDFSAVPPPAALDGLPETDGRVKEEIGPGIWPEDPFPSAVMHIDEDAERDLREAQQHAYPVALAREANRIILGKKRTRPSQAPSEANRVILGQKRPRPSSAFAAFYGICIASGWSKL